MFQSIPVRIFHFDFQVRVISVLIALIAFGAFIRFFNLTYSGLWLDEIYSMIGSHPGSSITDVYNYSKHDQPPVYFFLLHGWLKVFGYSDFSGRALSCLIGLCGIAGVYFLGKEARDAKLGLIAALMTSINWFHVELSKEIRFYSLVFLFSTLSYVFFIRALRGKRLRDFILYALFTSLLLNTHYYAMVVFASQFIIFAVVLLFYERSFMLAIKGLCFGLLAGLSLLHWLPVILGDLQISTFHISPMKATFIFDVSWGYFRDPFAFGVYVLCGILVIAAIVRKARYRDIRIEHIVLFGWIFLGLLIPIAYSLLRMPLINFKYTTIIVPGVLVAIASGFAYIKSTRVRTYLLAAIVLSGFILLFFARPSFKHRREEDWREVAGYFKDQPGYHRLIFSQVAWFHQYYFKNGGMQPPVDQNVADFNALIAGADSVWLFENSRYTGAWPTNGFLPTQQDTINTHFLPVDTIDFKQTRAILFNRRKP